jgi:hypothetical protein
MRLAASSAPAAVQGRAVDPVLTLKIFPVVTIGLQMVKVGKKAVAVAE